MSNIAKSYFELQCLRQEVYDAEQELHLASLHRSHGSRRSAHLGSLKRFDPASVASLSRGSETSRGGPTHH